MNDFLFFTTTAIVVIAICGLIGGVIGFAAVSMDSAACHAKWPTRNPSYSLFEGCMIDTSEGRVPSRNYMVLE